MRIDELFVKGTEARGHLSEASNALHDIDPAEWNKRTTLEFLEASQAIDEAMRKIDTLLAEDPRDSPSWQEYDS